jgi:hypothetical protein
MTRAQQMSARSLFDGQPVGGYTLPSDVIDAYTTHARVKALTVNEPEAYDVEDAAGRIVWHIEKGETPDVLSFGRDVRKVIDDRLAYDQALRVYQLAIEQSAEAMTNTIADRADSIVTDHLRPAFNQLLADARQAAADLNGYFLDDVAALITAPAKVRNAYAKLPALVTRWQVIEEARAKVNFIGNRTVERDVDNLFGLFQNPLAFLHGYDPNGVARPPALPIPEDITARLLWLASDAAQAATPWFPTTTEQDAAWWNVYGAKVTAMSTNAHNMRAMAAQAVGIERHDGGEPQLASPPPSAERQKATAARLFGVEVNGGPVEDIGINPDPRGRR